MASSEVWPTVTEGDTDRASGGVTAKRFSLGLALVLSLMRVYRRDYRNGSTGPAKALPLANPAS